MKKKRTELTSITHKGQTLKAGDCVLLNPDSNTSAPYVGKVKKITQTGSDINGVELEVTWFYRPEEAVGGRKSFHGLAELFDSEHADTVNINTIISKCQVHTLKKYEALEVVGEHDYFTRFLYKPQTKEFHPDKVPVYCLCEMPYNPDKNMIMCDNCEEWYHPECLKMQDIKNLENFTCPDCKSTLAQASKKARTPLGAYPSGGPIHRVPAPGLPFKC